MLGIELGSFWQIFDSMDERIEFIKDYDFDCIQSNNRMGVLSIKKEENREYLFKKGLIFHLDSLHLDEDVDFSKEINIDKYVMHPDVDFDDDWFVGRLLVENLDVYYKQSMQANYLDKLLFKYNMCYDISHALSTDDWESLMIINEYKIKLFHLSNYNESDFREHKCHVPFYCDKNNKLKDILSLIEDRELKDISYIMEYNFESIEEFENEYNYLKEFIDG